METTEKNIKRMKSMMESIYAYGKLTRDDYYLRDYREQLSEELFNSTFELHYTYLVDNYDIIRDVYVDSEGCTYNELRKKN